MSIDGFDPALLSAVGQCVRQRLARLSYACLEVVECGHFGFDEYFENEHRRAIRGGDVALRGRLRQSNDDLAVGAFAKGICEDANGDFWISIRELPEDTAKAQTIAFFEAVALSILELARKDEATVVGFDAGKSTSIVEEFAELLLRSGRKLNDFLEDCLIAKHAMDVGP